MRKMKTNNNKYIEERKLDLLEYIDNDVRYVPLVEEMIYLEKELEKLRNLPKILVNSKDEAKQKPTPAGKMYKEYLQQYINIVKALAKSRADEGAETDSPLDKWLKARGNFETR